MPPEGKDKSKGKVKHTPAEILKDLFNHPKATPNLKDALKDVDFEREFDEVKVAKCVLKCVDGSFGKELESCISSLTVDPFDRLIAGVQALPDSQSPADQQQASSVDLSSLEFYLTALKSIAYMDLKFEGLADILQIKFKQPLIKVVLCDKLSESLRNEASLISERIMERNKFMEEGTDGSGRWLSVYLWVVKCCLREGTSRADIRRVWSMHKLLTRYSVPDDSPVLDVLAATVVSPNFLAHKEGRQHIAHLLSLDKALVVPFHVKIKAALPYICEKSKVLACSYGEVFNMAWTNALLEVRKELEDEMLQRWMELYLKLDRPKYVEQSQLGKVVFRILSYLHNSRRLLELSSAITRIYQPILWRALKSHHPLERCNAAELFLDVFPLEKPDCNIVEKSNFKAKQFRQIMDLLQDESHYTRIVAIKGAVLVLERRIDCLSSGQCKEILSWLANELTQDGSTYLVRVAVWEFFASLASSSDPPEFLITLLPKMSNFFHDVSEHVRKAFATMLLNISKNDNLPLSFTDVAPMSHIISRLALDGEQVGKVLVQLVMKSIYTDGMEIQQFIKRLKRLILMCPRAAENLFRWSCHVLTVPNAQFVIMSILIYLRSFTKGKIEERAGKSTPSDGNDSDDKENTSARSNLVSSDAASPSASPVKKKRKKTKGKKQHSSTQQAGNEEGEGEEYDIDGPTAELHAHMLGCAHVTWIVFSSKFDSSPEIVTELNNVVHVCLQNYLRCYKGTPAWYASLSLASLVPITKLSDNTTASSSCLGELRRTEMSTQRSCTEALIYTLTAWNRGNEVIELAMDFIDPAFKQFRLNSSVLLSVRGEGRGRTVRFMKDRDRHMVGVHLLTILLNDFHNEQRLLHKHYHLLHELYLYLEGIKVVIEAAVTEGLSQENADIFTDDFIVECFELLLQLISTLDRAEAPEGSSVPPFVSTHHMIPMLEWAGSVLVPRVKAVEMSPVTEEPGQDSEEEGDTEEEEQEEEEVEDEEEDRTSGKSKKAKERTKKKKEQEKKKKEKEKKKKKKKQEEKKKKKVEVKEGLVVACLKAVMKATTFMVKIEQTDRAHSAASAKLALSLIQSDGRWWFTEGCLDLVVGLSEHTRAWQPGDEHQTLSLICPSLYTHIVLSLTSASHLTLSLLRSHNSNVNSVRRKLPFLPVLLLGKYGSSHANFSKVLTGALESCVAALQSEAVKVETVETVAKLDDLPLGVTMVTTSLLSRPKLIPLILPAIVDIVKSNLEDGVVVVCSLSYLFTVIENYKKILVQLQMEQTVHELYPLITALRTSTAAPVAAQQSVDNQDPTDDAEDSFFANPLDKLDFGKLGIQILQKVANAVPCSLFRPPSPVPSRRSLAPTPRPTNSRSI